MRLRDVGPDSILELKAFHPAATRVRYFDLKENWQKVKPHLSDEQLNDILVTDFNKFTFGRWQTRFVRGQYPRSFETICWSDGRRGRKPAFWYYVKHSACHWLVNFTLRLAQLVEPKKRWRIITSVDHSTVWDGHDTLFDFNYQAIGILPGECFERAYDEELKPGEFLETVFAAHYSKEP